MSAEIARPRKTQQGRQSGLSPTIVVILIVGLGVAVTGGMLAGGALLRKNKSNNVQADTGPKLATRAELVDFADHPEKWKGRTITMEVMHYSKHLNEWRGQNTEMRSTDGNFNFMVNVPDSDDLPKIGNASYYYATIKCTEGSHKSGNELVSAKRK